MFISRESKRLWKKFFKNSIAPGTKISVLGEAISMYGDKHDKEVERAKNAKTEKERLDAEYDAELNYEYCIFFSQLAAKELRKKWFRDAFVYEIKRAWKNATKIIK